MSTSSIRVVTVAAALVCAPPAMADHKLSIDEAIHTAISNTPEIFVAREDSRIVGERIALARAAFASRLFGSVTHTRDDEPPQSTSFGGLDTVTGGEAGITGRLESTGLAYTVAAGLTRVRYVDPFSTVYNPAYTSTARFEVVQPLLRGAFGAASRSITVASLRHDRSKIVLQSQVERIVGEVEFAYWNLVRANAEHAARASAVTVAKEQVDDARRIAKLGTGSDLEITESQAGVSRQTTNLLRSEQDIALAEGRLLQAMGIRSGSSVWGHIEPTDAANVDASVPDIDAQIAIARSRRADARAARAAIAAESSALEDAADQRRVALDLVGGIGVAGFAGTFANNTYVTQGLDGLTPPFQTDPDFDGGIARSFGNAATAHNLRFYVGLRFEIPLGDSEADVRHAIQERVVARTRLVETGALVQIENEVRTAVEQVRLSHEIVETSDATVKLSEKLLEGTRKRFKMGSSTSFDVLRVSEDLTRARIEASRARAEYRANVAKLGVANGTLLEGLGIDVSSDAGAIEVGSPPKPPAAKPPGR